MFKHIIRAIWMLPYFLNANVRCIPIPIQLKKSKNDTRFSRQDNGKLEKRYTHDRIWYTHNKINARYDIIKRRG